MANRKVEVDDCAAGFISYIITEKSDHFPESFGAYVKQACEALGIEEESDEYLQVEDEVSSAIFRMTDELTKKYRS